MKNLGFGAFLVAVFCWSGMASGATYQLDYTGIVYSSSNPADYGKSVTGQLVFSDQDPSLYFADYESTAFGTVTSSFKVGSGLAHTSTSSGFTLLRSPGTGSSADAHMVAGSIAAPVIDIFLGWSPTAKLLTLATLPANKGASVAYFGATLVAMGQALAGGVSYQFVVNSYSFAAVTPLPVSTVPLPAAGWLLLTAMGGLGWAGRRQRRV
jgi:hypothetical protein